MTQERDALQALRAGDFKTAASLLKVIVETNNYSSPPINTAYTLALYKIGEQSELVEVCYRIGNLLVGSDPGLAMDFFQRSILAGLSADRVRKIGELFEKWATPRSSSDTHLPRMNRVAHVVGCLLPGHAPSLYVQLLSKAFKELGVESYVFTTEWAASWFFNAPGVQQSEPIEIEAKAIIASIDGNFLQRAERIAHAIKAAGIDIVLYHASLTEQITARVAAFRPARIQLNVNHAAEMDADLFEGFVHLFENGVQRTRFPSHPWRRIPLISDIEDRLNACVPATRSSFGLDDAETVSGTFGNLYKVADRTYLESLAEILKRFPRHFHVFAGAGDEAAIKDSLNAAGVLSRVRFVGHIHDVAPLLGLIDLYLNSFPHSGGQSVLEPMAAGKPVVIRRYVEASHYNVGAELAGLPDLIAGSEHEYIAIADRLLRYASLRTKSGDALRERFRASFRPRGLAQQYVDFFRELCKSR